MKHTVEYHPDYVQLLLTAPALETQMLSMVDVSMSLERRFTNRGFVGFHQGQVMQESMLDIALLQWCEVEGICCDAQNLSPQVLQLLALNKTGNPLPQKYATMLERPHPTYGVPVLSQASVANIMKDHSTRGPLHAERRDAIEGQLALVAEAQPGLSHPRSTNNVTVGTLKVRNSEVQELHPELVLSVTSTGQPVSAAIGLTTESALMPHLFPEGKGFLIDTSLTFHEYC